MKKNMTDAKEVISVEKVRNKLSPMFQGKGLLLILLFGLVVSGKIHKKAIIDLAFLFDKPIDILALTNKVIRLLHTDRVDVVDLKRANPLLKFSAVKSGSLLYEREPGTFNGFYSLAFRMYIDTRKLRDAQADSVKRFLKSRGF